HVTFSGATPSIDPAQSTPGVSVATSAVPATTCVKAPFTPKVATGNVDFIADPNSSEVLELTVVTDSGHRCGIGQIEVNTHKASTNTDVPVGYYVYFSS